MSLTQMFQHLAKQIVFDRRCMPGFKVSVAYTIVFIIIILNLLPEGQQRVKPF